MYDFVNEYIAWCITISMNYPAVRSFPCYVIIYLKIYFISMNISPNFSHKMISRLAFASAYLYIFEHNYFLSAYGNLGYPVSSVSPSIIFCQKLGKPSGTSV